MSDNTGSVPFNELYDHMRRGVVDAMTNRPPVSTQAELAAYITRRTNQLRQKYLDCAYSGDERGQSTVCTRFSELRSVAIVLSIPIESMATFLESR